MALNEKQCPRCHQPCPADAPEGLCPQCLANVGLGAETAAPGSATVQINPHLEAASAARVAPDPAQLATQFPQLEIIELLGMGGMGMVYKARHPRLDRLVALKILPMDAAAHPSFGERFGREAKAMAKLNHPGIVAVYDFGQTGQYYYLVMEYVEGMNLRRLLNTQAVAPRQALELVVQICTGLQYAHDQGVVHRDIKPENILLSKEGRVKIADFGLAKLLGQAPDTGLTMSQVAMGTLNYMAPEQRQDAQKVDHRADIYSLGVVFYEMLTGEVPMGRFDAPSKKVQIDVRLDEVVLRALEREPARRYQHASDVKSGVQAIAAPGAATTPETSAIQPAPPASAKAVQVFWFQTFGWCCAGWLLTKCLWNLRSPGCWLASIGMATLMVRASRRRMRLFPEMLAIYHNIHRSTKIASTLLVLFSYAIGFALLIGAVLAYWEEDPLRRNAAARSAEQFEAQYRNEAFHLLQPLPAFSQDIPQVELLRSGGSWQGGWVCGWGAHRPGHHFQNLLCNLVGAFLLIFSLTHSLICGFRIPGSQMELFRFNWRYVRATLALCAALFGSLLVLLLFCNLAYFAAGRFGHQTRSFIAQTNLNSVTDAIEQWSRANGYGMGDRINWSINTVPQGKPVARARLLEAWKVSPFDRWRSTLLSFERRSPYLAFELIGSLSPPETHITVTGAMDCSVEQVKHGSCHRIPEDLIAALQHLTSAQGEVSGAKHDAAF